MRAHRDRQRCPSAHTLGDTRGSDARVRAAAVQSRLKVGAVRGPAETEADRVAAGILGTPVPGGRSPDVARRSPGRISRAANLSEGARRTLAPPRDDNRATLRLGAGAGLPLGERAIFEPRFGVSLANVRIHTGRSAADASDALGARAFTTGRDIAFGAGEYRPGSAVGRHLLAHELTHIVQQASGAGSHPIQRAMKFELQNKKNIIHAWDEASGNVWYLPRKFGSRDYIYKGGSGARLESETDGQVEFETEWERKWPRLAAQLREAYEMTEAINTSPEVRIAGAIYRRFPERFPIPHLRKGGWKLTKQERKKGKQYEDNSVKGHRDRPLRPTEHLVVRVGQREWPAYIQISESIDMSQYPSLMRQYELDKYDPSTPDARQQQMPTPFDHGIAAKVTSIADGIIAHVTRAKRPKGDISDLRGFLELIVNLVIRGRYPAFSPIGEAAKYTFAIMSRTDLGSVHEYVLNDEERELFSRFVADAQPLLLDKLGLAKRAKFFVYGHGGSKRANPQILTWLKELTRDRDILSALSYERGDISGAMGKFRVNEEKKEQKGLVRLEVRFTSGNIVKASKWEAFGKRQFLAAMRKRPRPAGKGETGLKL
jgi:hypothetical protein